MRPYQKPHPWHGDPQLEGISQIQSFSVKSEGSVPHLMQPDPWDLHQRDELPIYLSLKTSIGSHPGDPKGYKELRYFS